MERSTSDLCSLCRSIPWDCLEQDVHVRFRNDEKQAAEDIQTTSCRICRLMALAMPKYRSLSRSMLEILWNYSSDDTRKDYLGTIGLLKKDEDCIGGLILTTEDFVGVDSEAGLVVAPKRIDFVKVRGWLEDCRAAHLSCEPENSHLLLNLKVIDCVNRMVVVAPIGCSFVALSYVWGQLPADSQVLELPVAFPPTVEDAIVATQKIGYRYLWVDRYVSRPARAFDDAKLT